MRHSLLVTRYIGAISAALLTVTAVNSPARAQWSADPQGEVSSSQTATLRKELPDAAVIRFLDADASVEATSEEPTPPSFSGPILERSKLSGDWHGHRTCLQDCGVTFDLITTQFYQGVATGGLQQAFQYGGRHAYGKNEKPRRSRHAVSHLRVTGA